MRKDLLYVRVFLKYRRVVQVLVLKHHVLVLQHRVRILVRPHLLRLVRSYRNRVAFVLLQLQRPLELDVVTVPVYYLQLFQLLLMTHLERVLQDRLSQVGALVDLVNQSVRAVLRIIVCRIVAPLVHHRLVQADEVHRLVLQRESRHAHDLAVEVRRPGLALVVLHIPEPYQSAPSRDEEPRFPSPARTSCMLPPSG